MDLCIPVHNLNTYVMVYGHQNNLLFQCGKRPKGFCQVKIIPKIREKLRSGLVGQAPTRILIFLIFCVFSCFFVLFSCFKMFQKKIKTWIMGWVGGVLTNPNFPRIFRFFLT